MLALLSDLHFCDRTAVEKNVSPAAFRLALDDIYEIAKNLADKQGGEARLDIVLLGDIFDLLRTERWFEDRDGKPVPVEERPWGVPEALKGAKPSYAVLLRARAILDEVIAENREALDVLSGRAHPPPAGVRVRRLLIPGNHDRLCLHEDSLLRGMREGVSAETDQAAMAQEGIHLHRIEMPAYGLLARHGHEWDPWNFEPAERRRLASEYADEDYLPAPIGDPITTELAARLPWEMKRRLAGEGGLSPEVQRDVYARLQRIEDVRPLLAALQWPYYESTRLSGDAAAVIHAALADTVRHIAGEFRALEMYNAWKRKNDRPFRVDPTEVLGGVLDLLSVFSIDSVGKVAGIVERQLGNADPYREGAALEALAGGGPRYVIYGHTHEPAYTALRAGPAGEDVYLNTGTFRSRVLRTADRSGFVTAEHLTYTCLFTAAEAKAGWKGVGPSHLAWTGTRSR